MTQLPRSFGHQRALILPARKHHSSGPGPVLLRAARNAGTTRRLLCASALVAVLAGCQSLPTLPAYPLNFPDTTPPTHAALLEREREVLAGTDELLARPAEAEASREALLHTRANAHLALGHANAAISDLQEAIRLQPGNAALRLQLSRTLWVLDRETEAREQNAVATTIAPQEALVKLNAGLIDFSSGHWAEASTLFDAVRAKQPDNPYYALYSIAARMRLPDSLPPASDRFAASDLWPMPIIETLRGNMTPAELLAIADHPDPLVAQTWRTETAFYLGELATYQGDEAAATGHYRDALRYGVPLEPEYILARARLRAGGEADPAAGLTIVEPAAPPADAAHSAGFGEEWSEASQADLEISRLVRSGAIDRAILRLRDVSGSAPTGERLRTLASLQAMSGRAHEALATWRSSLRGDAGDAPALTAIGWLELQLAFDQGNAANSQPGLGRLFLEAFDPRSARRRDSDRHLAAAREALERARTLRPDDPVLIRVCAQTQQLARDFAAAHALWRQLREQEPDDIDVQVGEASALTGLNRLDEAQQLIEAILAREPNHPGANAARAEIARRAGREQEANQYAQVAEFTAWLPRGSRLQFSPAHAASVQAILPRVLTVGPYTIVPTPESRAGVIKGWLGCPTPMCTEFLAAAWWNPLPDDTRTLDIARALHERGATAMLRDALDHEGNLAALGAAAHALAEAGETSICDRVIDLLQQDQNPLFVADFAGALAVLGEYRAAMPLAAVLDPDFRSSPRFTFNQQQLTGGYRAARARAALALASFDSAYARAVLEAGTRNPEIALHCHAALFIQTKDPAHWTAIASALRYTDIVEERRTFALLERSDDPAVTATIAAWERRWKARVKRSRR